LLGPLLLLVALFVLPHTLVKDYLCGFSIRIYNNLDINLKLILKKIYINLTTIYYECIY
jgi:hypothetical protein